MTRAYPQPVDRIRELQVITRELVAILTTDPDRLPERGPLLASLIEALMPDAVDQQLRARNRPPAENTLRADNLNASQGPAPAAAPVARTQPRPPLVGPAEPCKRQRQPLLNR